MDRRFVLGLLLSLTFVIFWIRVVQPWLFPKPPQAPAPVESPESRGAATRPETGGAVAGPEGPASRPVVDAARAGTVTIENANLRLTFSPVGATMIKAELKDYRRSPDAPDYLDLLKHHPEPADPAAFRLPRALELRDTSDASAWLEARAWRVVPQDEDKRSVTFVLEPGEGGFSGNYRIRKQIRLSAEGRHAEVAFGLEYLGSGSIEKPCRLSVTGGVSLDSDVYGTHDLTGAASWIFQDDPSEGEKLTTTNPLEMGKVDPKPGDEPRKAAALNGRRRFVADTNNYFGVFCGLEQMPQRMQAAFVGVVEPGHEKARVRCTRTRVDLDFNLVSEKGKPVEHKLLLYFGPNEARYIEADLKGDHAPWAADFSRIYGEALGTFAWVGKAVLFLLRTFDSLTGNWGVAIMLLTFFVRLVLFPINRRSQIAMVRHSEAMSRIKPKLDVLKEKYKNDSRRFLAEQQALLKGEKVPLVPLGGCLPLLLQIPIFYGLFAALRASIELRQAPFLWALDLSQPDHLKRFATPYANPIAGLCCCAPPGMSDTISGIHLLPILMTAAWFVNQILMPKPATEDPQMAQQRKMMMFLPLLMGFMMYGYGAGLSLYWLTSSLLGIVESRVIKKGLPPRAPVKPATAS